MSGDLKLEIFDLLGKQVKVINKIPFNKYQVDISALKSGIYLYSIKNENGRMNSGKIIKK